MDLCRGRIKEVSICEHAEKCNEKIDCTSSDDWVKGIFPVYCTGFGEYKCMRDDGGIKMSEAVREMTREELFSECTKLEMERLVFADKCNAKERQIKEMQSHIDCLKAELAEVQMKKQELPEEPIKVAEMLISSTDTYTNFLGKEQEYKIYNKSELKQIAEHLLVYCNHAEVE